MKQDIFNGKIKKEYYSYILGYMIFFVLLFVGIGSLCVYASIWCMASDSSGERLLMASFGIIAFLLAFVYLFLELLVIRRFPKHEKLRRIMFNSDIYFTDSTSNEYFGGSRTIRGRRNKAAFDLVTVFAGVEKGMGDKKPIRYKIYLALVTIISILGLAAFIVMPLLFEDGVIFPELSDDAFALLMISIAIIYIALELFFLIRALEIGMMAPLENHKWKYQLYTSLVDISVRQNNKKRKYWYRKDQLEQIEALVKSASENAELKIQTKGNKLISFMVIDTLNGRVTFTGLFI